VTPSEKKVTKPKEQQLLVNYIWPKGRTPTVYVSAGIEDCHHGWTKPPAGFVKLNTDATVNMDTRGASTGCIIRDSAGQFLAACRIPIEGVIDVATAVAEAVRDGLRLAERIGCNHLYVETDALGVAEAFINSEQNRTVGLAFHNSLLLKL
jgi:hypothetical protein